MRKSDHRKKWKKIHARNCSYKVKYATHELALKGAIEYRKRHGVFMRVYKCENCQDYHVGHDINEKSY